MSKTQLPYHAEDISSLAKSLRRQLDGLEHTPSHVDMLQLLAKAGGYRNYQHFRAQCEARERLNAPAPPPAEVDFRRVSRVVRLFDEEGRLIRWPGKFSQRMLCLWVMWSRIPARKTMTEGEISEFLDGLHLFGDHALLRRELVDRGMVERTPDGRQYKRLELPPPAEALALLERLRDRE